jgi:hypothetical protein
MTYEGSIKDARLVKMMWHAIFMSIATLVLIMTH